MYRKLLADILFVTILLTACAPATPAVPTPDIMVIKTSVAYTVIAEITLTAAAFTPTLLAPTETPTPEEVVTSTSIAGVNPQGTLQGCIDGSDYGVPLDVNIPDNTEMTAGQSFVKTWKIKNTGSCPWRTGYTVVYGYGDDKMNGVPQPLVAEVSSGVEVEISIDFKAPSKPGTYTSYWRMSSPNGGPFGKFFSVKIIVK
jgi:hypothetical protein